MKIVLTLLTLVLVISSSYGQYDCSQGDGTFRYGVKLYIANVQSDFDKNDLIDHITSLDNIPTTDLNTLIQHITLVYKTFPSQNPHNSVTVFATTEIYSILDSLNNSIEFQYCVLNSCPMGDGTFHYYALLTLPEVSLDFNKNDFIDLVTLLDNISSENLTLLKNNITSVFKAFPSAQSEFLQRVVYIEATTELFQTLDVLNNSIEHHECIVDSVILNTNSIDEIKKLIVYPNPVSETLHVVGNKDVMRASLYSITGQQVVVLNDATKEIDVRLLQSGLYFLELETSDGSNQVVRFVKE